MVTLAIFFIGFFFLSVPILDFHCYNIEEVSSGCLRSLYMLRTFQSLPPTLSYCLLPVLPWSDPGGVQLHLLHPPYMSHTTSSAPGGHAKHPPTIVFTPDCPLAWRILLLSLCLQLLHGFSKLLTGPSTTTTDIIARY